MPDDTGKTASQRPAEETAAAAEASASGEVSGTTETAAHVQALEQALSGQPEPGRDSLMARLRAARGASGDDQGSVGAVGDGAGPDGGDSPASGADVRARALPISGAASVSPPPGGAAQTKAGGGGAVAAAAPAVLSSAAASALAGLAGRFKIVAARLARRFAERAAVFARYARRLAKFAWRGFWRGLRRRTNLRAFAQDYRTLQALVHRYIFDRELEQLFFIPTWRRTRLQRLSIASPHRGAGHAYRATPRLIFDWAMAQLPRNLKEYTFIDIGAGRGRVLLLASRYNFEKVRGVEFAAELHDDAEMNIAQFPRSRMKCRDVECWHMDALDLPIPDDKLVFYFFDPFSDAMLQRMMARIVDAYRARPRTIYLIFVDPPADPVMAQLVEESNIFSQVPFSRLKRLALRYLSPAPVRVYRSQGGK